MGISLGALAGLPPSPLFVERGADRRRRLRRRAAPGPPAATALLLALGFLGLAHALIETTVGKARRRDARSRAGLRGVARRSAASSVVLPARALPAVALWLPGQRDSSRALVEGIVG